MKRMVQLTPEMMVEKISKSKKTRWTRQIFNTGGIDIFFNIDTANTYAVYPQIILQNSIPNFEKVCLPADRLCHSTKCILTPVLILSLIILILYPNIFSLVFFLIIFDLALYPFLK